VLGTTVVASHQSGESIESVDDAGRAHGPFDLLVAADGARSRLRSEPALEARVREFPLGRLGSAECAIRSADGCTR
jgi:2-polyprenyl-6-methoxyphenol hydroxylase-like FAD-dependent oxidoreductase